jgi:outer membrane lipoprotein-sorting protein
MQEHSRYPLETLLGQVPVDDGVRPGHRDALRERALADFDQAAAVRRPLPLRQQFTRFGRFLMTHPAPRWTVLCVALIAAAGLLFWPDEDRQAFALEQMIDSIVEAKTAKFHMTVTFEGQPEQTMTAYSKGQKLRQEMTNGFVNIADWTAGKMVGLDPSNKTATVFNLKNMPQDKRTGNQFEQLRVQLKEAMEKPDSKIEKLGTREIDGRQAVGFLFETVPHDLKVWGDAKTGLPLRIESTMPGPPQAVVSMSEFQFNLPLDDSLFSTAPPEGYTVHSMDMDASLPTEKDLITALRLAAELSDGEFPDALNTLTVPKIFAGMAEIEPGKAPSDEQMQGLMQKAVTLGRGLQYAITVSQMQNFEAWYGGEGVKLGDAEQPIFWTRPRGEATWRVIYGDLSVKEDQSLPQVEGAQQLHKGEAVQHPSTAN